MLVAPGTGGWGMEGWGGGKGTNGRGGEKGETFLHDARFTEPPGRDCFLHC